MISVLHAKFSKLIEGERKDKTKYYQIQVLEETEKYNHLYTFFVDNKIALNMKSVQRDEKIGLSFDIWFSADSTMQYKLTNIVIEK